MIRLSQLRGQRVLTRSTAQLVGSIDRLLVDQATASITHAQLDGVAGIATILPWSAVASIGPDAVMVDSAEVLQPLDPGSDSRQLSDGFVLQGKQVLNELGDSLGPLEDIEFDAASGRIVRLQLPGRSLPLERFVALGPDALIVPAGD